MFIRELATGEKPPIKIHSVITVSDSEEKDLASGETEDCFKKNSVSFTKTICFMLKSEKQMVVWG